MRRKIRLLRDWGEERRYEHTYQGFNYRMDGIQGAVLRVKLRASRALDRGAPRARRRAYAAAARRHAASDTAGGTARHCRHVYHVYAVRLRHRDQRRATPRPTPAFTPACTTRSRCTCSRPIAISGTAAGDFPGVRGGGARGVVAAHLSRAHAGADRRQWRRLLRARRLPRRGTPDVRRPAGRLVPAVHGRRARRARSARPSSSWPTACASVTTREALLRALASKHAHGENDRRRRDAPRHLAGAGAQLRPRRPDRPRRPRQCTPRPSRSAAAW